MNLTGDVSVLEGDSVSISCFSTGNPVPTITWYLGTSVAPFPQRDTINDLQFTITGSQETLMVSITNGDITSELMIENATYPAHEGEYTCVGFNSNREGESTNNATINVQVQGKHIKAAQVFYSSTIHSKWISCRVPMVISYMCCVVLFVPIQFHRRYRSQRLSRGLWLETPPPSPALSHEATPWAATPTDGYTTTPSLSPVKLVAC